MFDNDIFIIESDKERLMELLKEADLILNKYPYVTFHESKKITAMSRAKTSVKEARQWCNYLHIRQK